MHTASRLSSVARHRRGTQASKKQVSWSILTRTELEEHAELRGVGDFPLLSMESSDNETTRLKSQLITPLGCQAEDGYASSEGLKWQLIQMFKVNGSGRMEWKQFHIIIDDNGQALTRKPQLCRMCQ
eukprot:6178227-Pleurochrysis_carterae.AAC.1